uniref:Uncharacterized protein n=1 Tax=Capra hircus TaxID=9925 RepID=A0A8C2XT83_CAPHI
MCSGNDWTPLTRIGLLTSMSTAKSIITRKRMPAVPLPILTTLTGTTKRMTHACPTPVHMVGTASSGGPPSRAAVGTLSLETDVRMCKTSAKTTHVAGETVSLFRVLLTTAVPANTLTGVQTAPEWFLCAGQIPAKTVAPAPGRGGGPSSPAPVLTSSRGSSVK